MRSGNSVNFVAGETAEFQKRPLKRRFEAVHQDEEPGARCEASPIEEHRVQLPEPEYRHVAGYVRRKTSNTVRADPAPNRPPQTSSTPRKRLQNQRKKGSSRPGNGSGSDSDTDSDSNERPKRNGHGISVARRRAAEPSDTSEPPLPNLADIEREESDRTKLHKTLQKVTDKWRDIHRRRRDNQEAGEQRRETLLQHYRKMTRQWSTSLENPGPVMAPPRPELPQEDSAWMDRMVKQIEQWNTDRRDFLEEVLHGDIYQRLLKESHRGEVPANHSGELPPNPSDYLEDILGRVESNVIVRCSQFEPCRERWGFFFQNKELRLVAIVKALYYRLWRQLSSPEKEAADVAAAVTAFVRETCPDQAISQDNNALTNAYMARIVEALVKAALRDQSTAQRMPDAESLGLLHIIRESRNHGRMTPAYMAWMFSDVETNAVEQHCLQWQNDLRAKAVEIGRVAMKAATQQKFCRDIIRPGVVSLVLFKDNSAQTIRDLSAAELRRIGWIYEPSGPSGSMSWRYKIYPGTKWDPIGAVFKVSMDEEILGMWMSDGTFLGWDEVQDQDETS